MDQKKIGAFIARMRKEKELTQATLGERLGVTNKTVSRWENGNYMPDISLMASLCEELEISVNELLSGERLTDENYRQQAEENLLLTFEEQKRLKRRKRLTDFLEGGGTGLLVSVLMSPEGAKRTIVAVVSLVMIVSGWYLRRTL